MAKAPRQRKRAVLYARVSTAEQAERGESIAGQVREIQEWAARKGYDVVTEYVEPGQSGTDNNRPVFQSMIERLSRDPKLADALLVHTTSRFMRNTLIAKMHKWELKKRGIRVIATTQETTDDPGGELLETIFEGMDQHASAINGVRTRTGMREIARQGFFPGGHPPYGFRIEKVSLTNEKTRNKLVVEPTEAAMVERIFKLYRSGLGAKRIASKLNSMGLYYRNGKPWQKNRVLDLLSDEAVVGTYWWARREPKTKRLRPRSEWIAIPVEPLISRELFDESQKLRKANNPEVSPGRTASSPMLLAGLLHCEHCGARFVLQTSGKSTQYRYYACRTAAKESRKRCASRSYRDHVLEEAVLRHIADQLFTVERCRELLHSLAENTEALRTRTEQRRAELQRDLAKLRKAITKWEAAFESGALDPADGARRYRELQDRERQLEHDLSEVVPLRSPPPHLFRVDTLRRFQHHLRARLLGEDRTMARTYLRHLVERIDVRDSEITITAKVDGAMNLLSTPSNAEPPACKPRVRTCGPTWLRRRDSKTPPGIRKTLVAGRSWPGCL